MPFGPKNLKISFTGKNVTHFGGIYLLHLFLKRIALKSLLSKKVFFAQRNNHYAISEVILALIYPIILGFGRIETTHLLKHNGVFLEACLRSKMREWVQALLEAEVDELLGRRKSERRQAVDAAPGYRSGHGKPRRLTLCNGTVTLRRPRVRGLAQRFESRLLPLFARRTPEVNALLPELYLHGLAMGDFDLALRGLLGEEAPLSTTTVARLKERWHAEWQQWASRSLADLQVVYLWVDGVYVKAGLEKEKAAVLVVLAGLRDGRKELVALVPGHRESTESWSEVLRDLKARGLSVPTLVVGDGHLEIWAGLRNVYPEAKEQRCWNHRICNALDKVPKTRQAQARLLLTKIPYAPTQQEAERLKAVYQRWCRQQGLEAAAQVLDRDWERVLTFYQFPIAHWVHLRTSNPIESLDHHAA